MRALTCPTQCLRLRLGRPIVRAMGAQSPDAGRVHSQESGRRAILNKSAKPVFFSIGRCQTHRELNTSSALTLFNRSAVHMRRQWASAVPTGTPRSS